MSVGKGRRRASVGKRRGRANVGQERANVGQERAGVGQERVAVEQRKPIGIRSMLNLAASLLVTALLLAVAALGLGPLPPLGPAFNPGTGVWTAAADATLPQATTLHLAGLDQPVSVTFEANGTAHVVAGTDHDMFLAIGYLHARFRLFQMDLQRRQGEGLLSQILGSAAFSSDVIEDQLGLLRTAQAEWDTIKRAPASPSYVALTAYAQGVNDRIDEAARNNTLPTFFKLLNYQPLSWTPVDSLVVQGDLIQTLDLTSKPLDRAVLVRTFGPQRTNAWFPTVPADVATQRPYDSGPYRSAPPSPLPSQLNLSAEQVRAVAGLSRQLAALPAFALHGYANSNNWAVDGARTASGKPLMAGDPHLRQTLPAVWYQLEASSPSYYMNGVGVPGTPIILIGRNHHISWNETNVQNQATLFYIERTDARRPNRYYWNSAWRPTRALHYTIPVKGNPDQGLDVRYTVHGPVIEDAADPHATVTVDWMGALPTDDIGAMLGVIRASDFAHFRDSLRGWHAPSQNFVYADDRGNIGMVSAGYYPIVKSGSPALPLPGTGQADVVGTIPFDAVPQVYDPPGHIVFSANQRPVTAAYPYDIGASDNFFDNGYRADRIYQALSGTAKLTMADMERLQNDTHDYLASLIVPRLLDALKRHQAQLDPIETLAWRQLSAWNDDMGVDSSAATVWWQFWSQYLQDTFGPWWTAYKAPSDRFPGLTLDTGQTALVEDLEAWTLRDPTNATFTPPHGTPRTASDVMYGAFQRAVALLTKQLGSNVRGWTWGKVHARQFPSLAQVDALSYPSSPRPPRPSSGDAWTVDAAPAAPGYPSSDGPSWRFITDWGSGRSEGVYPGGQSENPLSPWYSNQIETWWQGRYYPLRGAADAQAQAGSVAWTLTP